MKNEKWKYIKKTFNLNDWKEKNIQMKLEK